MAYSIWPVQPALAPCIIFIVLFTISSAGHFYQLYKYRPVWFFTAFAIGTLLQVIGFIGRAAAVNNLTSVGPYVVQSLFILLAPILYAASIYSLAGKIMVRRGVDKALGFCSPAWMTRVFVGGDLFAFLLQSSGGGLIAKGNPVALTLIIAGLAVQLVFLTFFALAAGQIWFIIRKEPGPLRKLLKWTLIATGLLLIRSIYRLIEYGEGRQGYLMIHEVFIYVFDTTMMFIVQCVYHYAHPGLLLQAA